MTEQDPIVQVTIPAPVGAYYPTREGLGSENRAAAVAEMAARIREGAYLAPGASRSMRRLYAKALKRAAL